MKSTLPLRVAGGLAIAVASAGAQTPAGAPAVALPTTPAGSVVAEWLDAFNSGDSVRLGAYYKRHRLVRSMDVQLARRASSGGFELVSIESSRPNLLEMVLKEKNTGTLNFGVIELEPDGVGLRQSALNSVPTGGSIADFKIDAATKARVIENAIAQLEDRYVFPDVATKMGQAVRARLKRGEYDHVVSGIAFASLLTDHFRDVSHDKHLGVNFSARGIPDRRPGPPDSAQVAQFRQQMLAQNCGFVKSEVQSGNIGYLKFNFFANPDVCGPTASTAMNTLANTDALIVDLRENGGGDPAMVAYVSSYLFSKRTHLNDLWTRKGNETNEYWTRDVPGPKFGGEKPVYVLTAARTFSGAEEFTYNLKNLKRATIIGETTGGGAHPVSGEKIDAKFVIGVPFARAINPISKTNWEGTGVEPDVKVPADDALATALRLIAERKARP